MRYYTLFFLLISNLVYAQNFKGAWQNINAHKTTNILATENYIIYTEFDNDTQKIIKSWGGKYNLGALKNLNVDIQFNSQNPSVVSSIQSFSVSLKRKNLEFEDLKFQKLNDKNEINGLWKLYVENAKDVRNYLLICGDKFQKTTFNVNTSEFLEANGGSLVVAKNNLSFNLEYHFSNNEINQNFEYAKHENELSLISLPDKKTKEIRTLLN